MPSSQKPRGNPPREGTNRGRWLRIAMLVIGAGAISVWASGDSSHPGAKTVPMSELVQAVEAGKVERAEISTDTITVELKAEEGNEKERLLAERLPNIDETALLTSMRDKGVVFEGKIERAAWCWTIFAGLLPFLVLGILIFAMSGGVIAARNKPMSFGRSKAKLYDKSRDNAVTFTDVAGVDEAKAELTEIVGYLKDPAHYTAHEAFSPLPVP